jgi:SAM-dependent methyltransferase
MICPVCSCGQVALYDEDKFRQYFLCSDCQLVFVPREKLIAFAEEAARYEAHNNDEGEQYRQYLARIVEAIRPLLVRNARGLDFGCGKTTLLAKIFAGYGVGVESFDLYFHPRQELLQQQYDFIVLSEVIEHLHEPLSVMQQLRGLLKPHGQIYIKTKLYPPDAGAFHQWFYKRDITHVQFFNYESMGQLARLLDMQGPTKLALDDLYALSL